MSNYPPPLLRFPTCQLPRSLPGVSYSTVLPENFTSKLGAWDPAKGWVPMTYKDCFVKQSISGVNRIVIATAGSSTGLVSDLLEYYPEPYRLAYLLVTPPDGFQPMKYEVEGLDTGTVHRFFEAFRPFLEGDARHHVWIHSAIGGGTIINDEHDWLYAYGSLDLVEQYLVDRGFADEMPEIPFPHLHNESSSNDAVMRELLGHFEWKAHPVSNLG